MRARAFRVAQVELDARDAPQVPPGRPLAHQPAERLGGLLELALTAVEPGARPPDTDVAGCALLEPGERGLGVGHLPGLELQQEALVGDFRIVGMERLSRLQDRLRAPSIPQEPCGAGRQDVRLGEPRRRSRDLFERVDLRKPEHLTRLHAPPRREVPRVIRGLHGERRARRTGPVVRKRPTHLDVDRPREGERVFRLARHVEGPAVADDVRVGRAGDLAAQRDPAPLALAGDRGEDDLGRGHGARRGLGRERTLGQLVASYGLDPLEAGERVQGRFLDGECSERRPILRRASR